MYTLLTAAAKAAVERVDSVPSSFGRDKEG